MKTILTLRKGWELCQKGGAEWLPATIPAGVQEILLQHRKIPDPREFDRAKDCLWVAEKDWIYRCRFAAPTPTGRVFLLFKGLDTIVDVLLNGERLASHNDLYLPLRVEVTGKLRAENELQLHFHSPYAWLKTQTPPKKWQGKFPINRLLRKPHEDFNSFNGAHPYYTPIGVFDDIELQVVDGPELGHVDVRTDKEVVTVAAECAGFEVQIKSLAGKVVAEGRTTGRTCRLRVKRPELWWPRGHGGQPLYEVIVGNGHDRIVKHIGFRTVKLDASFKLWVNGRRVRLWGINLCPFNALSHRKDLDRMRTVLDLIEAGNMNTVRAWGPGAPWPEELFAECDRRGLLVWAEFFHTWGMYPDSKEFQALCRQEAEHYVRTLRHHPSIFMWCGGNECYQGSLPPHRDDGPMIGRELYEKIYRDVCRRLNPDRFYHVNSPYGGKYPNDPLAGDSHGYTHQWFVPGEFYPVIFTENTRVSPPLVKSLRRMYGPDLRWPTGFTGLVKPRGAAGESLPQNEALGERPLTDSEIPALWKKCTLGDDFLVGRLGPVGEFYDTGDTPAGLVYRLGAAHCLWIRRAVERYRRGRPVHDARGPRRTQGHYLWFCNNIFPAIASNTIDAYLEPKMAHYALRRAYAPLLLSFEIDDHIHLWGVNDTGRDVTGTVVCQMRDPDGVKVLKEIRRKVQLRADESRVLFNLDAFGMFSRRNVLFAEWHDARGGVLARANDFAAMERNLSFPDAQLSLTDGAGAVTVTTDKFARCVELQGNAGGDEFGWYFEDNFFDLLPGEVKTVRLLGRHRHGIVTAKAQFATHSATVKL